MRRFFRHIWLKIIPRYELLERRKVTYDYGDGLIKSNSELRPESTHWVIDDEREDNNRDFGWVHLCRRRRITE